jgi:hypothetical protein
MAPRLRTGKWERFNAIDDPGEITELSKIVPAKLQILYLLRDGRFRSREKIIDR